jgi:hypothetical protein
MKKKGIIICSIIGVLLIVGGILLLLLLPKKSNKELYTEALEKSLGFKNDVEDKNIKDSINEFNELIKNNIYKISIDADIKEDEAGYNKSENVIYFGKNNFYLESESLLNDKTLNLKSMLKDDKLYFELEDVLDKIYYIDGVDQLFNTAYESGDTVLIEKIASYLGESFKDAIKNKDIVTEKAELVINGEKYNAKLYGYTFTGNTLYDIVVSFIEKIKKDDSIYNELEKSLKNINLQAEDYGDVKFDKDTYYQALEQIPEYAKQLKTMGDLATLNIYLHDGDLISREIVINVETEQGKIPLIIADYTVDNYYKAAVSSLGFEAYKLEVKGQNANNGTISFFMMDQELLTGYYSKKDGNYELKLETAGNLSGNSILIKINNDGTGSLKVKTEFTEANLDYEIEQVDEIPEMNVRNSVSYEEMTESDKQKLEVFMNQFNVIGQTDNYNIMRQDKCIEINGELKCLEM